MQKELISVIVPIYNAAPYLEECLESIAAQTYTGFECILVDDGSTDSSGAICDDFCRKDSRFRVIHQENSGVGFARNRGLDQARGTYIQFIDSDDVVLPGMLQAAATLIQSGAYDWVSWNTARIDAQGKPTDTIPGDAAGSHIREYDSFERLQFLTGSSNHSQTYPSAIWNKLYSRALVGGLRFIHACYYEDFGFNFILLQKTRRTAHLCQTLYLWRQHSGSATHTDFAKQVFESITHLASLLSLTCPDNDIPFRGRLLGLTYRKMQTACYSLMGTDFYPEFSAMCKDIRKNTLREYASTKMIPLTERLAILVAWHFPHIGKLFFKLLGN